MASMSPNMYCGNCSRKSRSTKAVKYCTDCGDLLCTECLDVHGNIQACAFHHIIDINAVDGKVFNISKSCRIHSDMVLEYFCSDHDALCCRSCMASAHRSCDKLLPIEVAAKGIKSTTMYEEIVNDVKTLNSAVNELEEKKRKNISTLNDSKVIVQQDMKKLKEIFQKSIHDLETAVKFKVEKNHSILSEKAKVELQNICYRRQNVQNISEQFESASKHCSESQTFMLIHNIKEELNCQANHFQELGSSQKDVSLSFKESNLLSVVTSFGTVEIKEVALEVQNKPFKVLQAQNLQQQRKIPTQFKFNIKFEVRDARGVDIGVTKDNMLFLCNTGSILYVMSDKGRQLATLQMDGRQ
ncbi:unnamed protein product [Mytilus coruscus]|uniref:B box-type domain-containing protein n=1 Tax=Mytilus coruscus TaxID=42192 RepID=A0A6J8ETL9_MYTCO|nr:unnamed protein product [Mytilus coruscus]